MYIFSRRSDTTKNELDIVSFLLWVSRKVMFNEQTPSTLHDELFVGSRTLYSEGYIRVGEVVHIFLKVSNSIIDFVAPVSKIA